MSREFDSRALAQMARVLQQSTGSPQLVELDDQNIQQSFDLNPFVRRGLVPVPSQGIFTAQILNTHIGTDVITTEVNPYSPGTTFVGNGYPAAVGPEFDIWITAAQAQNITGSGDFGGGELSIIYDVNGMGWRNEANGIAQREVITFYSSEQDLPGLGVTVLRFVSTKPYIEDYALPRRVGRNADGRIRFTTVKTGAGAATYKLFLTLGIFPAGLGQDAR